MPHMVVKLMAGRSEQPLYKEPDYGQRSRERK